MKWLAVFKALSEKAPRIYVTDQRTPEQEAMHKEQMAIQSQLGFERGDTHQNWLRMHQILLDHEKRLTALEGKK